MYTSQQLRMNTGIITLNHYGKQFSLFEMKIKVNTNIYHDIQNVNKNKISNHLITIVIPSTSIRNVLAL